MDWARLVNNFERMKMVTEEDSCDYRMYETGWKREVLLICDLQRLGAWADLKIMSQMFEENGFVRYVEGRPTKERLRAALERFWRSLTSDGYVDSFALVIMAHGSLGRITLPVYMEDYYDYDDYLYALRNPPKMDLEEIFQMFNNRHCPAMRGKPRLFIVQACRTEGDNRFTNSLFFDSNRMYVPCVPRRLTSMSDYVIVYATHPGKLAYRHPWHGCPLFTELEKVVSECGWTEDILQIFTKVTHRLKQRQQRDWDVLGITTDEENSLHTVHELSRNWYLFNPHLPYVQP